MRCQPWVSSRKRVNTGNSRDRFGSWSDCSGSTGAHWSAGSARTLAAPTWVDSPQAKARSPHGRCTPSSGALLRQTRFAGDPGTRSVLKPGTDGERSIGFGPSPSRGHTAVDVGWAVDCESLRERVRNRSAAPLHGSYGWLSSVWHFPPPRASGRMDPGGLAARDARDGSGAGRLPARQGQPGSSIHRGSLPADRAALQELLDDPGDLGRFVDLTYLTGIREAADGSSLTDQAMLARVAALACPVTACRRKAFSSAVRSRRPRAPPSTLFHEFQTVLSA
jgi:hypothetical protein